MAPPATRTAGGPMGSPAASRRPWSWRAAPPGARLRRSVVRALALVLAGSYHSRRSRTRSRRPLRGVPSFHGPSPTPPDALPENRSRRATGTLFLGREQLLVRRVVAQRPQRRVEVHHPAAWIALRERLLYQRDRGVTLAQNRVDPCPPHRVPAVQIPGAHRLKRPLEGQRVGPPLLARRQHAEKPLDGHPIGRVPRDDRDPPHRGVVRHARGPLRRETLEQAPRIVDPSPDVIGEGATEPGGHA